MKNWIAAAGWVRMRDGMFDMPLLATGTESLCSVISTCVVSMAMSLALSGEPALGGHVAVVTLAGKTTRT